MSTEYQTKEGELMASAIALSANVNAFTRISDPAVNAFAEKLAGENPRWRRAKDVVGEIYERSAEPWVSIALDGSVIATVRPGGIVLLIGGTGSGKSSLIMTTLVQHAVADSPWY